MKKVCLITPNLLPVPNVKGGAIETLVTNIVKLQEEKGLIDLTIVSIYDEEALLKSKDYSKTSFIYIKKNFIYMITSMLYKVINKLFRKNLNTYNHFVLNKIKNIHFDYVIAEGGHYDSFINFLKYFDRDKMVLHLHHQGTTTCNVEKTFSKVIGVSQYVIDDFKENSNIERFYLLKNSIDISLFDKKVPSEEINALRTKFDFKKDDFIIIFCGRLIKEKGVLELIQAVNNIDNQKIKLLIVGSINFANGGESEYTKLLSSEANKKNKVAFTGYVKNTQLYKYYNMANIMVIPSQWNEAAGLVCIEGMICKKPIITTDAGGIHEYVNKDAKIVKRGKNFVIDLEKAILEFYNNKELLKIGDSSYKDALKYSSDNYYKKFVRMLEDDFKNEKEK